MLFLQSHIIPEGRFHITCGSGFFLSYVPWCVFQKSLLVSTCWLIHYQVEHAQDQYCVLHLGTLKGLLWSCRNLMSICRASLSHGSQPAQYQTKESVRVPKVSRPMHRVSATYPKAPLLGIMANTRRKSVCEGLFAATGRSDVAKLG